MHHTIAGDCSTERAGSLGFVPAHLWVFQMGRRKISNQVPAFQAGFSLMKVAFSSLRSLGSLGTWVAHLGILARMKPGQGASACRGHRAHDTCDCTRSHAIDGPCVRTCQKWTPLGAPRATSLYVDPSRRGSLRPQTLSVFPQSFQKESCFQNAYYFIENSADDKFMLQHLHPASPQRGSSRPFLGGPAPGPRQCHFPRERLRFPKSRARCVRVS